MIRVASYNMRKAIGTDRRRRPERTLEVLCELDADVIALQEADRRFGSRASAMPFHLIEEHSDYKPVPFEARDGSIGWHGNALLVKKDVEIVHKEMLHLPSLEPRGAVLADLKVGGEDMRVVGMHLDLSGLWRRRQAHRILACKSRSPSGCSRCAAGSDTGRRSGCSWSTRTPRRATTLPASPSTPC